MITLYSKATSNGRKASIMLEESALDYRVRPMDLDTGEQKEDWYLAINPNGRIPCIVDDGGPDGRAVTVFESGAILIYLAEKSARLLPEESGARMEVLNWLFFASGHITHTGLGVHWQIRCRDAGEEHPHLGVWQTENNPRLWSAQPGPGRTGLSGGGLFHRRHRRLPLDLPLGDAGDRPRPLSQRPEVAGARGRPAGGAAGHADSAEG